MKKIILGFLLLAKLQIGLSQDCDNLLKNLYQVLHVDSDKAFLKKVHNEYKTASQRGDSYQSGASFNIPIPEIGSLGFNDNYETVTSMYNSYERIESYSLSDEERYKLSRMFTIPEDVRDARTKYLQCLELTKNIPSLKLGFQNETSIVINFKLSDETADSATVRSLIFSDNLKLESDNVEGKTISRKGSYSLRFKRIDKRKAYVQLNLQRGEITPLEIPQVGVPVYRDELFLDLREYSLTADIGNRILKIKNPDNQIQTFDNFKIDPLYGAFAPQVIDFIYRTEFNNTEASIKQISYLPVSGGIRKFDDKQVVVLPDGKVGISIHISPSANLMKGNLRILFERRKRVCVANCPE